MNIFLQQKFLEDNKMALLLKHNSYWYKALNRDSDNYQKFVNDMKDKYHLKVTDRINNAIDNIDLISDILKSLK